MTDLAAGDAGTPGPGAALRLAREELGLSQQQAAEQLTLDVGVITALDRDDFAALGADVHRFAGDVVAVQNDATGVGWHQTNDHIEAGGFTGAVGSKQAENGTFANAE